MNTILVTGASRGIGRALALSAQSEGYRVVGLARSFSDKDEFETIRCDVCDAAAVTREIDRFKGDKSFYGVINAAGRLITKAAIQYRPEEIAEIVTTNLMGTMHVCTRAARLLMALRRGRIINISSIAASIGLKGDSVYSATKAGVEVFSRSLAREMAERNVTVNCIAPGPMATEMTRHLTEAQVEALIAQQILPRQIDVEELWPIVRFLLSDGAASVTGEVIHVGGV
jgi:3-oxoacyl-[acyl-carrier protein] reductase